MTALAPASATTSPTAHVTIQMFAFNPSALTARMGTTVIWTNTDSVAHTTTSNEGFWSSPHLATNATYAHHFTQAGTYPYHCAIHTEMHGRISVPMRATSRTGGGVLTWAIASGKYDVQIERPGSTTWSYWRRGTTARGATFLTSHHGRWHFRARTYHSSSTSGWSPAASLLVG
ncbi:MAG: cupredoxin domain-containing protein [Marmoricola sp.]